MKKLRHVVIGFLLMVSLRAADSLPRPNVLFFFVDDWGRYASIYADPDRLSLNDIVKTPNMDRVGREGVVFNNAFVPVSSCTPSRASLATGRYFWNCGSGAFLNGKASDWKGSRDPFPAMTKFPDILRDAGYLAMTSGKTISFTPSPFPGKTQSPKVPYQRYGVHVSGAKDDEQRRTRILATLAQPRAETRRVLDAAKNAGLPFFFVYGTTNVHRPWVPDSGHKLWGISPDSLKGRIPKFLPDVPDVRRDFSDYLGEIQAADAMLGVMLSELEAAGQLDNTIVILSGDNGVPGVPRGKTHCYDLSVRAPLLVRWPAAIKAGRRVDDFINLMDIGPTLLEAAGLPVPATMDGRSFLLQLTSLESGWIDPRRDSVVIGRELHFPSARDGNLPYPMRAIRTKDHLYIHNFKPDRWPSGAPDHLENAAAAADYGRLAESPYRDMDASLTKSWLLANRTTAEAEGSIALTLGKRPEEELYSIQNDPDSLHNLASDPAASEIKKALSSKLMEVLEKSSDPRLTDSFDKPPYVAK